MQHDVLSIEPAIRRRERTTPATPLAHLERGVAIPVQPLADRAPTARPVRRVDPTTTLTEQALAMRFFPLVAAVAALDLATKAWAVSALSARSVALGPLLSLSVAMNRGSAGGVSLGDNTRAINFTATGLVVGFMVMLAPTLTGLDRRAWRALALIAGAGLGNMVSLLQSESGVPDFIALHYGSGAWVLNVADVVLVVGLVLLARVVVSLARRAR